VGLFVLALLTLVVAACGSAPETGAPGSSESVAVQTTETVPAAEDPLDDKLEPPAILLVYRGEEQRAVQGSYCVDYVDKTTGQGQGVCSDAAFPTYPDDITAIGPGERVRFVVRAATLKSDSVVTVRPLGCTDQTTDEIVLPPGPGEFEWEVELPHGAYQLDVFARFRAEDGRRGDVSGSLGLTVAGPKKFDALGVFDLRRSTQVCPFEN